MNVYIINAKNILVINFAETKIAAILFLFLFTNMTTCNTIKQFQLHINNIIVDINDVCTYCNLFILLGTNSLLIILTFVEVLIIVLISVILIIIGLLKNRYQNLDLQTVLMFCFVKSTVTFLIIWLLSKKHLLLALMPLYPS